MDDLFEEIMIAAIRLQTSDIHILLKDKCYINYRIHGQIIPHTFLNLDTGKKLINFLRYKANIDINFRLKPQTGHFVYLHQARKIYVRLSSLPGQNIDSLVIRLLYQDSTFELRHLTPLKDIIHHLNKIILQHSGLFIISGPTGSGKSTTLYTLLDEIQKKNRKNIITIEDPIEVYKDYCLQIQLNNNLGINYHDTLKQILRHDPDVIMIGEIRDETTAKLAITCALTGHLVLTTIHAGNAITTIKRLLNLNITKLDLEDILIGVMSQRMIYSNKTNKPIVLAEFLEKEKIKQYLNDSDIIYKTFDLQAKDLINQKIILKEDVEGI